MLFCFSSTFANTLQELTSANRQPITDKSRLAAENQQLASDNRQLLADKSRLAAENQQLASDNRQLLTDKSRLAAENQQLASKNRQFLMDKPRIFCIESISRIKKLFLYYTGFHLPTFYIIFNFLVPDPTVQPFRSSSSRNISTDLCLQEQLLLVMCKLRNNFHFKDIGFRFGISAQSASLIFSRWINYMFLKFSRVPIWPHRDVLFENMPAKYRKKYPNTFVIIDSTEIKIQRPSSLKRQSQCYSTYKSHTTMKKLVGVDPCGSVIFVSTLFAGSISDKSITARSGLLDLLEDYVNE